MSRHTVCLVLPALLLLLAVVVQPLYPYEDTVPPAGASSTLRALEPRGRVSVTRDEVLAVRGYWYALGVKTKEAL